MLPCMCHGHASAPAGTWDTPGEPEKGLGENSQHSGKALCQPFLWRGFILGLQGSEAASESIFTVYFEMSVCEIL